MTIRRATQDDKINLNALHIASVRELRAEHYPAATIDAWLDGREPEIYTDVIATRDVVVAERDGALTAFGQLDRGVYRLRNNTELACAQMSKPLADEGGAR